MYRNLVIDAPEDGRGYGVYTIKSIPKNTRVGIYGIYREKYKNIEEDVMFFSMFDRDPSEYNIIESILGKYINHSIQPNLDVILEDGVFIYYSNQNIKRFDELTANYNFLESYVGKDFPFKEFYVPSDDGIKRNLRKRYKYL